MNFPSAVRGPGKVKGTACPLDWPSAALSQGWGGAEWLGPIGTGSRGCFVANAWVRHGQNRNYCV